MASMKDLMITLSELGYDIEITDAYYSVYPKGQPPDRWVYQTVELRALQRWIKRVQLAKLESAP